MWGHVRQSKYEPMVAEVELIHANTHYAYVKTGGGRNVTVSTHDLTPTGKSVDSELEPVEPDGDAVQAKVEDKCHESAGPAEQGALRMPARLWRPPPGIDL